MLNGKYLRAILECVAFMLFAFQSIGNAHAAQRFSFADLHWGDSYEVVEQKINAAGFGPLALLPNYEEGAKDKWRIGSFKGVLAGLQFTGAAYLHAGRLVNVALDFPQAPSTGKAKGDSIESLLEVRYGKPRSMGPPGYGHQWLGEKGEILEAIHKEGQRRYMDYGSTQVDYLSPEAARLRREAKAKDDLKRSQDSKRMLESQRSKAAKL